MAEQMQEIMTFKTGDSLFGVPIQNVLSILGESDKLSCKAFKSKDALGVIEYRGIPVSVLDLAVAGNIVSGSERKAEIIDILLSKDQEHVEWLDALEKSIENNEAFTLSKDPAQCDYGVWLSTFETNDEELQELLNSIDVPHQKIHGLADQLLGMKNDDNKDAVLAILQTERDITLVKLRSLFAATISHLKSSIKPVFIYLTLDGSTPCAAMRVDEIADVNSVADDAFVPMAAMALPQVNDMKYVKGFLKMGDKGECLLVDVEMLTNHRDMGIDRQKTA